MNYHYQAVELDLLPFVKVVNYYEHKVDFSATA